MQKPFDEAPLKVHEPQERLYLLLRSWSRPFCHSRYLDRVHANLPFRNDESEVLDHCLFEFAFVVLQEELVLS
jgi:hypothetical protein